MTSKFTKHRGIKKVLLKSILFALLINLILIFSFAPDAFAASNDPLVFGQVKYIINNDFINEVPEEALNAPNIKAMVDALKDPYSQYYSTKEYRELYNSINMNFSGIGVYIEEHTEGLVVTSVIDNSPAKEAGIVDGDIITAVDNVELAGMGTDKASSYIRGQEGTNVLLKIKRGELILRLEVTRKWIIYPTIDYKFLDNHIAYIRIMSFGEKTDEDFKTALEKLSEINADSYIIDLRNNGGGYLNTAISVAGNFIGQKPVVRVRGRDGKDIIHTSQEAAKLNDKNIFFLVNKYSASASEVLAACVKDNGNAYIIGTNTYGKGTVQNLYKLFDGSVLKLTIQEFFSPAGNVINKVGIRPNLEVDEADSLAVTRLLLGWVDVNDKEGYYEGYYKVKIGKKEFVVDLNMARQPEFWSAFRYILSKASKPGNEAWLGTKEGWVSLKGQDVESITRTLYQGYKEVQSMMNVAEDKNFTVTFNNIIDMNTINSSNIELVNGNTGLRTPLSFSQVNEKSIKVTPNEKLKKGETYYLVINNNVKDYFDSSLKEGVILKATVQK